MDGNGPAEAGTTNGLWLGLGNVGAEQEHWQASCQCHPAGEYTLPGRAIGATVAVKIVGMLGEKVPITQPV